MKILPNPSPASSRLHFLSQDLYQRPVLENERSTLTSGGELETMVTAYRHGHGPAGMRVYDAFQPSSQVSDSTGRPDELIGREWIGCHLRELGGLQTVIT